MTFFKESPCVRVKISPRGSFIHSSQKKKKKKEKKQPKCPRTIDYISQVGYTLSIYTEIKNIKQLIHTATWMSADMVNKKATHKKVHSVS